MSDKLENFLATHELSHHGVKGMKWGRRKKTDSVSTSKSSKKTAPEKAPKKVKKVKPKISAEEKASRRAAMIERMSVAAGESIGTNVVNNGASAINTALASNGRETYSNYVARTNAAKVEEAKRARMQALQSMLNDSKTN